MRLIPARAGTTVIAPVSFTVFGAHPRSRGDHGRGASARLVIVGSSPLARGPLPAPAARMTLRGLIPARAGTTAWMRGTHRVRRAHPRSRGDHSTPTMVWPLIAGSSPLARGPRPSEEYCGRRSGLIPARAGTTVALKLAGSSSRAHPRSRGDHRVPCANEFASAGSSPLARGPRGCGGRLRARSGLIPARAGTTHSTGTWFMSSRAHPRSRGDHPR